MLLRARSGERIYEVEIPPGARVMAGERGYAVVVIPGSLPGEEAIFPRSALLDVARNGRFGVVLRGEVRQRRRPRAPF